MVRETSELFAQSFHGCIIAVDGVVMYVEEGGLEATAYAKETKSHLAQLLPRDESGGVL